jgi:hypothetical protein
MAPAGDRFDSDCVVGTQFESSQPHHAVLRKRGFPGSVRIAPELAAICANYSALRQRVMFGTELSWEFMRDLGLVVFGVGGATLQVLISSRQT